MEGGGGNSVHSGINSISATGRLLSYDSGSHSFPDAEADNMKAGRAASDAQQTLNPPKNRGNAA